MRHSLKSPRIVAVAVRPSLASGRAIARGVIAQAKRCHWKLRLIDVAAADYAEAMTECIRTGAQGVIISELTDDTARVLSAASVATVVIGRPDARLFHPMRTLYVYNDDERIGFAGARHLASLGRFRSYGFIAADHPKSYCAAARETGFLRAFAPRQDAVSVLLIEDSDNRTTACDKLAHRLMQMKQPVAVMAATDQLALLVMEAAHQAGLNIPRHMAVIGVDNDRLLCELAEPSLTSIEPDHEAEGELAARALDTLMRNTRPPTADARINRKYRIVERESARPIAPATHLVQSAQDFIARNFAKGIDVRDVVAHLKVSRRLADLRYRELTGESIYQAIVQARMEKACALLDTTSLSVVQVIARCGFPDVNSAIRTFKQRFGVTMGHYGRRG